MTDLSDASTRHATGTKQIIEGVKIKPLTRHADERGYLMEILRTDDPLFEQFAQFYVSLNYPGVIRAWHCHKLQTDLFACVKGMIKVVIYDGREGSPTHGQINEFFIGDQNPVVVRIPKGVLHGYKTIGVEPSLLLNFPDQLYNPKEPDEYRLPYDTDLIPYDWEIQMR